MESVLTRSLWPQSASRVATAVGLLMALAGPPLLAFGSDRVFGASPRLGVQVLQQFAFCAIAAIVVLATRRSEQLPLASIGVRRPNWGSAISAVGIVLVARYLLPMLTTPLMTALDLGDFRTGLDVIGRQPVWWRVCTALTSGLVEEVLYRGYAVERLATLTGRLPLGGLLATVAFGAAHIPFWGLGPALAADLPFGALMTAVYVWRRDVVANAAGHITLLLIGLVSVHSVTP